MKKIEKKFSIDFIFQSWVIIPKTDTEKQKKNQQISENFLKFSYFKKIQHFRGPQQILARIRGAEE